MGKVIYKAILILIMELVIAYISGVINQLYMSSMVWSKNGMTGSMDISVKFDTPSVISSLFTQSGLILWLILSAIIIVFVIFIKLNYGGEKDERGIDYSKEGTYGTSGWMSPKERDSILEVSSIRTNKGILLGKIHNKAVSLPQNTMFNKHIAVFGASGSGKSRKFVRNNVLQMAKTGQSMILTDPKGELYRDMAEFLKNEGYTVKLFNLVDTRHSDRWNVLNEVTDDLTAQTFADVVISNTRAGVKVGGDPFWDRAEQNLLKALALYVVEENPVESRNMGSLYSILACGDSDKIDIIFEKLPADHPAKAPYNIYKQASDNVRTGVVIGLGTRLQVFQNKVIKAMTASSDIDLELPGKSKCAYFCIMSDTDTTLDYLASLFFSFLFLKLVRYADRVDGRCNPEVYFMLDEFPNIGQIPDFTKKISTIRSRGLSCFIIFQNIAQLKNRYLNDAWQEIIGNCDTKLFLGCTDVLTAEFVSDIIGVTTIKDYTHRKKLGFEGVFDFGDQSTKHNKRNLMNPDEVLRLPNDDALVMLRGQKTLKVKKYDYIEHPMAKRLKPKSISKYIPEWVLEMEGKVTIKDVLVQKDIEKSFASAPKIEEKPSVKQEANKKDGKNTDNGRKKVECSMGNTANQSKKAGFRNFPIKKHVNPEGTDNINANTEEISKPRNESSVNKQDPNVSENQENTKTEGFKKTIPMNSSMFGE